MKKLMIIAALFMCSLSTIAQTQQHCEYVLRQPNGKVFTGVDMPCGYKEGQVTPDGHTVIKVLATQCTSLTKSGAQCTRNAGNGTLFCSQHNPSVKHCEGICKSTGKKCNNLPSKGMAYCHLHKG